MTFLATNNSKENEKEQAKKTRYLPNMSVQTVQGYLQELKSFLFSGQKNMPNDSLQSLPVKDSVISQTEPMDDDLTVTKTSSQTKSKVKDVQHSTKLLKLRRRALSGQKNVPNDSLQSLPAKDSVISQTEPLDDDLTVLKPLSQTKSKGRVFSILQNYLSSDGVPFLVRKTCLTIACNLYRRRIQ